MVEQEFTIHVASVSDVQPSFGVMWYAECLFDLNVQQIYKTVIPLGYVIETSLIDGTVVATLLRSDISDYELSLVGNLSKRLMSDGKFVHVIVEQLAGSFSALGKNSNGSLLSDAIERSSNSSLCVRSREPVPKAILDISSFRSDMTRKEFETCLSIVLKSFKKLPFFRAGTISGSERRFIFAVP